MLVSMDPAQNYLKILIGCIALTLAAAEASTEDLPIQVSAACRDNAACIFDKQDIVVDITIKNVSNKATGVPVEYIKNKGPYCKLVDNETGEELVLRIGLPRLDLMRKFTEIPAGASISTEKRLAAHAISMVRENRTDLTATFTISAPFKVDSAAEPVHLLSSTTLRIIGKDKAVPEKR